MGFAHGVRCLIEGLSLTFSPRVRRYIFLPALVSLIIVGTGLYFVIGYIDTLSIYLASLSWWPDFLSWLVDPLLYLFGVLMSAWLFGFVATIAGSPFYGGLSARIDPMPETTELSWHAQILPTLAREWVKLKYTLPRLFGMFALGFVPGINLFAPFIWLGYGGWLMAVQFSDFRFENHGYSFHDTLATLRERRVASIGLGVGMTFGMSIPLLNFLVAPIGVVAATLFTQSLVPPAVRKAMVGADIPDTDSKEKT